MLSAKQSHQVIILMLRHDSTRDWNPVTQIIGEHSNHYIQHLRVCVNSYAFIYELIDMKK